MEAMFVKESMNIRWVAETGLVDAIEKVISEYKETRGLLVSRNGGRYTLENVKIKGLIFFALFSNKIRAKLKTSSCNKH